MRNNSISPEKAEKNDELLIIRTDGDITQDSKVRMDFGLLVSDRAALAIPELEPAVTMRWTHLEAGATSVGIKYVASAEPPAPEDLDFFVNASMEAQYTAEVSNVSNSQIRKERQQALAYWLAIGVCALVVLVGFVGLPMLNSWQAGETLRQGETPIATPWPPEEPLPTAVPFRRPEPREGMR